MSIPYHSIHAGAQVDDGITHVGYLVDPDGLTGGGSSLDGILTAGASAGLRAIVGTSNTLYPYQLVAGTDAEASPLVIRPDDYATTTNEKVWKLQNLATAGVLVNGATQPASLVGGVAWAAGTAPSADVADQVSLWVADEAAGRAALKVRGEAGGITSLGDRLLLDSGASGPPLGGSQVVLSAAGLGALSFLNFNASTQQIGFGQYYDGTNHIARDTRAFQITRGSNFGLTGNAGLTVGNSYSPTTRFTFMQTSGSDLFTRFIIGDGSSAGNSSHNVLGITNGVAPTTSPTNMAVFWAESGEPRFRTSGGRIRQLVRAQSHANATAETPTATHTLRMFDDAGTEYRVLAIAV